MKDFYYTPIAPGYPNTILVEVPDELKISEEDTELLQKVGSIALSLSNQCDGNNEAVALFDGIWRIMSDLARQSMTKTDAIQQTDRYEVRS